MNTTIEVKNVVLVHGGFVDGSGWQGVHRILKSKGFNVSIVQNPTSWQTMSRLPGGSLLRRTGRRFWSVILTAEL